MLENRRQWPDLPWKVKLFVATVGFGVDFAIRSEVSVNRRLMNFFDFKTPPTKKPVNGVRTADITVDITRNLWFRLFTPVDCVDSGVRLPVIFFFHGGGFALMAPDSKPFVDFCNRLARELPAIIISVNYRLAPEHRFPCQQEDCFDVMKFIDEEENIEDISSHANLKQCFVAGDSAGGNLAHHTALRASEYEFRRMKTIGVIAIQPFFGGEARTESETRLVRAPFVTPKRVDRMWKYYLPENSDRDHPAANVFGPNAMDMSSLKFPATIVFVGGFDPLQDWQKRYYEGLKKSGKEAYLVEYPNAIHSFYLYPDVLDSSLFIREVKYFMEKQSAVN
uniref:Arylacetamide deacetylase n=1 Tax=Rhizophora mucronata TaxID=61149 RepID=A0A2P2PMC0_RHIMU